MSAVFYTLLLVLPLISSSEPDVLTKCHVTDSVCITKSTQLKTSLITAEALSEIATESLDPLIIDVTEFDVAGLKVKFYKAVLRGFKDLIVDSVSIDPQSQVMRTVSHSNALARGRYSVDGSILGFAINENGEAEITSKNLQVEFLMPYEIVKDARGRNVMDLKSFQYKVDMKDEVTYNITNMFEGFKPLSDTMHYILNSNSKLLTTRYGQPLLDSATQKIFNAFRSYLISKPIEEVFY